MFYVYRFFDTAGVLLWVGQTTQLTNRFSHHWRERVWSAEIATATVMPVKTLEEALCVETEAIKTEKPKYNKVIGDPRNRFHPTVGGCSRCGNPKARPKDAWCPACCSQYHREWRAKKGIVPRAPATLICPKCGGPKKPGPAYCQDCKKKVNQEAYRRRQTAHLTSS